MKKRLESELISIAHRILKLKNKSEVDQLYLETRKLYETLSVLKFYGENYEQIKSEISEEDLEEKLAAVEENIQTEIKEVPLKEVVVTEQIEEEELEVEDEIEEKESEIDEEDEEDENQEKDSNDDGEEAINFEPIFDLEVDFEGAEIEEEETDNGDKEVIEVKKAEPNKTESRQISFEDLLGDRFNEPEFVKPNDVVIPPSLKEVIEEKPLSLNDQHSKAINIGMNDRIAFVKHLFGDSTEDYNRVLSQLNSFASKEEAFDFIEEIIKPDYENWVGSEEYAERFMEIVKNKFN